MRSPAGSVSLSTSSLANALRPSRPQSPLRNIAATGESGLQSTFAVIARLLRPTESESRGLFLGDLIVHLLRNAGPAVAPVLPELVKAIVERIPTATYTTFQQVRRPSLSKLPRISRC